MHGKADSGRFVVQEHSARTHHYDLRLAHDGVLKSWAVRKGIPRRAGVKRLAIQVEDHDLFYGNFEGEIPEGEYGAGRVRTWDDGTYTLERWDARRITIALHGTKLKGRYTLLRFPKGGGHSWLIFKRAG